MGGYIKLHRKLLDSEIFWNERLLKVWVWCLIRASYATRSAVIGHQRISLLPGQFITGQKTASEALEIAPATVWRYLHLLEELGNLTLKTNNKFTVVTVVNWDLYQSKDSEVNNKRITNEEQMNTNKKVKKEKKKDIADDIPYNDIISCLNEATNQSYKATSEKTQSLIKARMSEGYTVDDLIAVILHKAATWGKDPQMQPYLRPETLFGKTKFEGYVQQARLEIRTRAARQIDATISVDPGRLRK